MIPDGITPDHIRAAIHDLETGIPHPFGDSTGYDVLYNGKRYPPKAVVGLAAGKLTGQSLGPYDFKGGLRSKCFKVLTRCNFSIVTKSDTTPFPDEVDEKEYFEGAVSKVSVNRYERDLSARTACIAHHGTVCSVCDFDFLQVYGAIGEGFVHVHHTTPVSALGPDYRIDPTTDLRPVCPNCHAMLHKRIPPFSITELQDILASAKTAST